MIGLEEEAAVRLAQATALFDELVDHRPQAGKPLLGHEGIEQEIPIVEVELPLLATQHSGGLRENLVSVHGGLPGRG